MKYIIVSKNMWSYPEAILRIVLVVGTIGFMHKLGMEFGLLSTVITIALIIYSISAMFDFVNEDYWENKDE